MPLKIKKKEPLIEIYRTQTRLAQTLSQRKICFTSALLTASGPVVLSVLLCASTIAQPPAIGIMYLTKSDALGNPPYDLSSDPGWTNTHVQGVALRTQWSKIQPTEATFDWSFLDEGVALAAQHGKKVSVLITAGVTTPEWVYAAGADKFQVTTQAGPVMPMPLPWDPVFQAKWGNVIRSFGQRYGGNPQLVYVVMGGSGRRAESYFVFTAEDQAKFDGLGGTDAWKAGVEWIVDEYAKHFPTTPFILDLGAPVPTEQGQAALSDVCAYAVGKYPSRFGVKSDGLAAGYGPNTFGAKEIQYLSPTATVGFQMALPSKGEVDDNGNLVLDQSLAIGINLGAHFIEVYSGDCNDPIAVQALSQAGAQLLGLTPPKVPGGLRIVP
ncbi:MAG: beta-galactosidase [Spartobacteria bacterium]